MKVGAPTANVGASVVCARPDEAASISPTADQHQPRTIRQPLPRWGALRPSSTRRQSPIDGVRRRRFSDTTARVTFVYILRCSDGSLYTGAAKDLPRRLAQHAAGRASRYTRARLPVRLVWFRRVRTWSDALRSERSIKALRRTEKDALVRGARRLPRRR